MIVTPCVIINSFNRAYDPAMLKSLGIAALAAIVSHVINILISTVCFSEKHGQTEARWRVLRFGTIFSNCGFMALPLQAALLGDDGVFFGAAYIAVFNLFVWTYGLLLMNGSRQQFSVQKILLNPGLIAVFLGVLLFLSPVQLPDVISEPISLFAGLNTPVPMIIIGHYLASITSLSVLKDRQFVRHLLLRLVVLPAVELTVLYFAGLRGIILLTTIIAASSPTGANTAIFAVLFDRDEKLAVTMVSVTTLFSAVTMPLIVTAAMMVQ